MRARPPDRRGGCPARARCPGSSISSILSAVGRSTLRARYSKPDSRLEISSRISDSSTPSASASLEAVRGAFSIWKGVAKTLAASSDRASSEPRAVVDRAADSRDLDHLGLLALRVGAKLAALDGLEPRRPEERDREEKEEAGEEQAEASIDQAHGVTPPPVLGHDRRRGLRGGVYRRCRLSGGHGRRRVRRQPQWRRDRVAAAVAGSRRRLGRDLGRPAATNVEPSSKSPRRRRRAAAAASAAPGVSISDRGRLGHDEPDADRGFLQAFVRKAIGDVWRGAPSSASRSSSRRPAVFEDAALKESAITLRATMPTRSEPRTPIHSRLRVSPRTMPESAIPETVPTAPGRSPSAGAAVARRRNGCGAARRGRRARAARRAAPPSSARGSARRGCSCLVPSGLSSVRRDAGAFLSGICSGKLGRDAQMGRTGARIGLRFGLGGGDGAARKELGLGLVAAHADRQLGRADAALCEPCEEPLHPAVLEGMERDRGQSTARSQERPMPREGRDRPTRARRSRQCGSPGRSAWPDGPLPKR